MEFVLFLIFMFALGYLGKKSKKNKRDIFKWQQTNDMRDINYSSAQNSLNPINDTREWD